MNNTIMMEMCFAYREKPYTIMVKFEIDNTTKPVSDIADECEKLVRERIPELGELISYKFKGNANSFAEIDLTKEQYCQYCFNARVYRPTEEELMDPFSTELTDENDFGSHSVGNSTEHHRLMISSGYGEPVRMEIDHWYEHLREWRTVGKYYPKYCPECGRKLDEYAVNDNSSN